MNDQSFWNNRVVVVTGASSGIGAAFARHCAARGARVGLIARRAEALAELSDGLNRERGAEIAVAAAADVVDAAAMAAAARQIESRLGPTDVVFACAGVQRYTPGDRFVAERANEVLTTNVQGVVNTIGAVLPGMVERRRGHVAAVASIAAMLGLPEVSAYCASKAAVVTLLESLRLDVYKLGIRVTTLCPGFVDTPLIRSHDRRNLRYVLQPADAAARMARAIERGVPEHWFPWQTWLTARIARFMPFGIYRIILRAAHTRRPPEYAD